MSSEAPYMAGRAAFDVRCYAGSVGILVDRCLQQGESLGTTWLIDDTKAASCAHLVILYAELLPALKVYFPATRKECGVVAASFHPQLKCKEMGQMARKALLSTSSTVSLQENNLVVLSLTPSLSQMSADFVANANELLSFPPPLRDKGLSGNLTELDLPLVIQTITNARKHGTLEITNERNHTLAQLFLRDGRIVQSVFGSLVNETAIYQMTSQHLAGNFYFHAHKEPDWQTGQPIKHPADMLLIEAHRRLDEIPKYLLELGGEDALYERASDKLDHVRLPAEVQEDAQIIWPLIDGFCPIGQMWRLAHLDDYTVFSVLCELVRIKQIREVQQHDPLNQYAMKPLEIAPQLPLSPFDIVESLIVDEITGLPHMQSGHLLGALRPSDPWHLIHDLDLPEKSSGSPIFKDAKVIG
ncbi:MAG: DUF4388 domain-containing protein, partial [Candidatus Melainabacteria bacterium]|nr:DUF4388 domain-containing protein [Candidatus Melainabacteria bacterium]